ncbi:sensor histidine kinase [Amycolatopsis alkalitolerans]|uniref:histidine kinase n=1 Tax=Amycolatopsis alkalitolerans TaxID=2547244 RepID=A0A5C4LXT7_9PSEU|nr:HAMP domain-containing sensor histidine kinase [Amycolatopsis alkalitolerans]TNC21837.1 HAMP domain-containing histidine kinase [Amycolatopsis alkalitolerans]
MTRRLSDDARLLRRTALRAGFQSALAVAVTVAVLCGVSVLVVLRSQHADENTLLESAIARADDVSDPPSGTWLVIARGGNVAATPGLPPGLPDEQALAAGDATGTDDVHIGDREYRVLTERRGDEVVQAILDLRSAHQERERLLRALLITGLLGLLLAGVTGAWLGRRAAQPLTQALALQRRFVADAGHELRTPLTLLSTRAQLLRRHLGDARVAKAEADELVADARQLTEILEDLLLAADPREAEPVRLVDLADLARAVVSAAQPEATAQGVRLTVSAEGEVTIHGSAAALRRALNALLDNAIRHARGAVTVSVRAGREVIAEVADDGPGIDPALIPSLFTRFATGTTEDDRPRRRYGLGLALVSEIAARHGGSVSARNAEPAGAVFRLTLPH